MEEIVHLKITSGVVVDGEIRAPGAIVSLPERQAVNLLERGKAEVATDADALAEIQAAAPEPEAFKPEPEAPAPAGEPEAPAAYPVTAPAPDENADAK